MMVTRIADRSKYKKSVTIDYDRTLTLPEKDVYRWGLREGEEIPEDVWEQMLGELKSDCITKCGKLLKDQDYSQKGLRDKLLQNGYPAEAADYAVQKMVEARYVDDRRYAENYIRYHLSDRSLQRIRMDLKQKGIPSEILEEALEEAKGQDGGDSVRDRETAQAVKLLKKRRFDPEKAAGQDGLKEIRRQTAFLLGKGYSMDVIKRAMEEIAEEDG